MVMATTIQMISVRTRTDLLDVINGETFGTQPDKRKNYLAVLRDNEQEIQQVTRDTSGLPPRLRPQPLGKSHLGIGSFDRKIFFRNPHQMEDTATQLRKFPDVQRQADYPVLKSVVFAFVSTSPAALVVDGLNFGTPTGWAARWVVDRAKRVPEFFIFGIRGRCLEVATNPSIVRVNGGFAKEGMEHAKGFVRLQEIGNNFRLRREGSRDIGGDLLDRLRGCLVVK